MNGDRKTGSLNCHFKSFFFFDEFDIRQAIKSCFTFIKPNLRFGKQSKSVQISLMFVTSSRLFGGRVEILLLLAFAVVETAVGFYLWICIVSLFQVKVVNLTIWVDQFYQHVDEWIFCSIILFYQHWRFLNIIVVWFWQVGFNIYGSLAYIISLKN